MAIELNLDAIREAAEHTYSDVILEVGDEKLTLPNVMRLGKGKRKALQKALKAADDADAEVDEIDFVKNVLNVVLKEDEQELLYKALGEDATLYVTLLEKWLKDTQVGEA